MAVVKFRVGHTSSVLCISTGEKIAASGDEDSVVILWAPDGSVAAKLTVGEGGVNGLCLMKSKPEIFVASAEKVFNYDMRNMKDALHIYASNQEEVNHVCLNGTEEFLASSDDSGMIRIIKLSDRSLFKTLRKHDNICTSSVFRPDRPSEIVSAGLDCKIIRWDFTRGKCLRKIDMADLMKCAAEDDTPFVVNPPFIHSLSISNDGKFLAAGLDNAHVNIFDTSQKGVFFIKSLKAHRLGVSQTHFPKFNNNVFITGGNDCNVAVWSVNECKPELNGHANDTHTSASAQAHHPFDIHNAPSSIIDHGDKVNWLSSWSENGGQILVADQSADISAYAVH